MNALTPILKRWPLFAVAASLAMLGVAHAFESFANLLPCHLCLKQREVYWAAIPIALAVFLAEPRMTGWKGPSPRWLLVLIFLLGAGVAGFHAGVEWKWWPGPTTCTTGGVPHVDPKALSALLKGTADIKTPMCDKAAWAFLGLSMAGWNFLASLVYAGLSALSTGRKFRP